MRSSILVTGGAGYIGSQACKTLHAAGYRPVTLDDLSTGDPEAVRWGPLVRGDVADADLVTRTIAHEGITAVVHFAASSLVGESSRTPLTYYRNNIGGMMGLLTGMASSGCRRLIFSSSCAVYGLPDGDTMDENNSRSPISVYGQTKLMCEQILADVAATGALDYVALRYFNACGADTGNQIGERRPVETHLIPRALMALQGHITDFEVHGSDFETPDGTAIRDFIHVEDLAEAHVRALERLLNGGSGGAAFNLGTGSGHSVREVLRMIEFVTGRVLPTAVGPRRPGDPDRLVADASLAQRELNFRPTRSNLQTVIESAWRWHQVAHPARA